LKLFEVIYFGTMQTSLSKYLDVKVHRRVNGESHP